jgi:Cu/Ag efflux protein CusF
MTTSIRVSLLLWACALLPFAACRSEQGPSGPPEPLPWGTLSQNRLTVNATVEKIDLPSRRVTLRLPDGSARTITVSEEVRNLPQVKPGDQVRAQYFESVAFEVKPAGSDSPGVSVSSGGSRAEPGQMPAGVAASVTTVTTTITGIDKANGTVTLTGPEGESVTVKVQNPANLDRVTTGDLVDITYTEAVGISVERVTTP